MKTTRKPKGNEYPKPESAPEPATAVVLFKSGLSLTLEFMSNGSANRDAREKFVKAYKDWFSKVSNLPGGEFEVANWGQPSSPPDHQQKILILWDNVLAINHSR
jgi:hypothetical protein